MKRKIHTFTNIETECQLVYSNAVHAGLNRVDSGDRNRGFVHDSLGNKSEFHFIPYRKILQHSALFGSIESLTEKINLKDKVLTASILEFNPGDFLEWSEIALWKQNTVAKFFSIALTNGNSIEFKDGVMKVPRYSAIEFNTGDVHRKQPSSSKQTWLVLMIPDYFNLV